MKVEQDGASRPELKGLSGLDTAPPRPFTHVVPSDPAFTAFLVEEATLLATTPDALREEISRDGVEPFVFRAIERGRLTMAETGAILNRHLHDLFSFRFQLGGSLVENGLPMGDVMASFAGVLTPAMEGLRTAAGFPSRMA